MRDASGEKTDFGPRARYRVRSSADRQRCEATLGVVDSERGHGLTCDSGGARTTVRRRFPEGSCL